MNLLFDTDDILPYQKKVVKNIGKGLSILVSVNKTHSDIYCLTGILHLTSHVLKHL